MVISEGLLSAILNRSARNFEWSPLSRLLCQYYPLIFSQKWLFVNIFIKTLLLVPSSPSTSISNLFARCCQVRRGKGRASHPLDLFLWSSLASLPPCLWSLAEIPIMRFSGLDHFGAAAFTPSRYVLTNKFNVYWYQERGNPQVMKLDQHLCC